MDLNEWLNDEIPNIVLSLEQINNRNLFYDRIIGSAGKESIYKILHHFRSALFPGVYDKYPVDESKVNIFIGNKLRATALELRELIEGVIVNDYEAIRESDASKAVCKDRADEIVMNLINSLPQIRKTIQTDIEAAYFGDPAAVTPEEILLTYPSIEAVSIYRIAHELYKIGLPIIPRIMSEYAHQITGIDIHPGAKIGDNFFIDHGTGVVIGETCTIGNNVKLYQGVTLGAKNFSLDRQGNPIKGIKRHPDIEDNVVIYAGATVLGGNTVIGQNSIIGGNVWLTESVPPNSKVYNIQPSPLLRKVVLK
ncbi:serine acetyltransferase [Peribacillus frigoritolerans]|uniref:serine O-acetyltransferase EpsC n=1 Tax=Peribacillus frigoritolerans TaxID=450367 RepID=UPI0021D0A88B|nr:serine O-acetyltransferase EpsC [Peribacillus frigoritolerans]MCU6599003.1 serine acetyltransferase [Peribacillus frigoritolerans]